MENADEVNFGEGQMPTNETFSEEAIPLVIYNEEIKRKFISLLLI